MFMKSNSEVHLAGAVGVGILALASGLLPVPARIRAIVYAVAKISPLHRIVEILIGANQGDYRIGSPTIIFSILFIIFLSSLYLWRSLDWVSINTKLEKE